MEFCTKQTFRYALKCRIHKWNNEAGQIEIVQRIGQVIIQIERITLTKQLHKCPKRGLTSQKQKRYFLGKDLMF
jgi:hypothetical protein